MSAGASFALGPPRPPPHGCGGLLRLGIMEAPAAMARGDPSLWIHQGPRHMGTGASFALGPPRPPPHERGGLLRFGTTNRMGMGASAWESSRPPPHGRRGLLLVGIVKAPATWARGPPPLWRHRGPHRMGAGASFALGSSRPPRHGRGGLLRSRTTKAPTAWAGGPPPLRDH